MAEIVSGVVEELVGCFFNFAQAEVILLYNCSENVEKLGTEADSLSLTMRRFKDKIDLAKGRGERLEVGVEDWVKKANTLISDARQFIAEKALAKMTCCNSRFCVNLIKLHHYSKMAIEKTQVLVQHKQDSKDFESFSLPAPAPEFADFCQRVNHDSIYTQMAIIKEIILYIEDESIQIVGITGLGGVGKTTLANEAAFKMKNQFAHVVQVTVTETMNAEMIKEKLQVAASRILKGEKVLIILDDVWKGFEPHEVGIPSGNWKILLTSRSTEVCRAMNAKIIGVNPLVEQEAWTIFQRFVGDQREWDDDALKEVGLKIVKECGGLPHFVQAVAKTLKDQEIKIWKSLLRRLQSEDVDVSVKREGIMHLKKSYDHLANKVAKSCFLLCSLFKKDGIINLNKLTYYGIALEIFNNPRSIQDAKDIVEDAIESLKSSFLLLPVLPRLPEEQEQEEQDDEEQDDEEQDDDEEEGKEKEDQTKMHDLIREMALFITSESDDKFLVQSGKGLTEWQPRNDFIKSYKKISLMENKIRKLPDYELDLPHLDTFLVQNNELEVVPNEFFQGMNKLKLLDMSCNNISSLPESLKQLMGLRTLDLSGNKSLVEISILGGLIGLEILKLRSTGITEVPKQIGQLTKLRLLDVYTCPDLLYIAPGVISKLTWLEELYVGLLKEEGSYMELSKLTSLKILHLIIRELHCIPENPHFRTLVEFDIRQSGVSHPSFYRKRLDISSTSFPFEKPVTKLIQLSQMLKLWGIKGLNNILPDLYHEGFDKLKYIELMCCHDVTSLVKTSDLNAMQIFGQRQTKGKFFSKVEEILLGHMNSLKLLWDKPHRYINFCHLRKINIIDCPSLSELFPLSVAQGLVNVKVLEIVNCATLEVVVSSADEQTSRSKTEILEEDATSVVFPFTNIHLHQLPQLKCFYSGRTIIEYPSLESLNVEDCGSMKRWSYGENHIRNIKFNHDGRPCININDYIAVQHDQMNEALRIKIG